MKIKTKLFISFAFITLITLLLYFYFAFNSVTKRLKLFEEERLKEISITAEKVFYNYLSDINRKATFIADLDEIRNRAGDKERLNEVLGFKGFIFTGINIKILNRDKKIITEYLNSSETIINNKNINKIELINSTNIYKRINGIIKIKSKLLMISLSPIISNEGFEVTGFILLERVLNDEFLDFFKDYVKANYAIYMGDKIISKTSVFQEINTFNPKEINKKFTKIKLNNNNYFVTNFLIKDYKNVDIAYFIIFLNAKNIDAIKNQALKSLILTTLILIIFILIMSFIIGSKISSPILKLHKAAAELSKGNYDIDIRINLKDEIGDLVRILSHTAESLKKQKAEILNLKEFFEGVTKLSPTSIIIIDDKENILYINDSAKNLFNINNVHDISFFDLSTSLKNIKQDFYNALINNKSKVLDNFPIVINNEQKLTHINIYRVPYEKSFSVVLHIQDLTEKVKLESMILHYQKLGRIGEMMSKFSHDFNNLMTGMQGYVNNIKIKSATNENLEKPISMLEKILNRAKSLGKNFLNLTKKESFELKDIDIKSLIINLIEILEKSILKGIEIKFSSKNEELIIHANEDKLSFALLNIIINARDAIMQANKSEKTINIKLNKIYIQKDGIEYARIEIMDNGIGIDKKHLDKIFDPYFTTKGKKGTGVGLSTVKDIIEEFQGYIEIDTEKEIGTNFIIYLPVN